MRQFCLKRPGVLLVGLGLLLAAGACASHRPSASKDGKGGQRESKTARRPDKAPKAGDVAPTFTLASFDGNREVSLGSSRGKRPVVLFFGSYT